MATHIVGDGSKRHDARQGAGRTSGDAPAVVPQPPASSPIGATELQQATFLLKEIACAADDADRWCYHHFDDYDREMDEKARLDLQHLREVICRIGWMADEAARKVDGLPARRGPDAWLLPPAYSTNPTGTGA